MVDDAGNYKRIYCRRAAFHPSGGKAGKDGGASFPVDSLDAPPRKTAPRTPAKVHQVERADVDHTNAIYVALLRAKLELSDEHRQKLLARGLSPREIDDQGYASTPTREHGDLIAREMADLGLGGVPGFFSSDGKLWKMAAMPSGILIPYRDECGRICGLQYRRDDYSDDKGKYIWFSSNPEKSYFPRGTKSGPPLHFARHHLLHNAREIILTEGALKAQIASLYLNAPIIAAAGATQFRQDFPAWLRATFPKIKAVRVAFDLDWRTNPDVRGAALRLTKRLQEAGYSVRLRVWPPQYGKGIDNACVAAIANSQRLEVAA
jgi:hypothetical protein